MLEVTLHLFPQAFLQILKDRDYQKKLSISLIVTVTFHLKACYFYSSSHPVAAYFLYQK